MPAGFAKMTKGIASWGWSTVPQKHMKDRVLRYTQAKVIGGGSSINAQLYTRGNAAGLRSLGERGRLRRLELRDVLPYFKRAEDNQRFADDYHAYGGPLGVSMPVAPLPICEAYIRAGAGDRHPYNPDFNGAAQDGVGYYQLTQANAGAPRLASAYLTPIRGRQEPRPCAPARASRGSSSRRAAAVGVEIARRAAAARRSAASARCWCRPAPSARRSCCCSRASGRPII